MKNPPPSSTLSSRVAAHDGAGGLRLEERELAEPGKGEILLELSRCGFCGTDLFKLLNRTVPAGVVLGHELAGRVHSVGPEVTAFARGDRVVVPHHVACGDCPLCRRGSRTLCPVFKENLMEPGGFSDLVLIRERAVRSAARLIPDGISDEAATFLEPAACVLRGVVKADIAAPDGCVVIIGGGSMGLLHLLVLSAVMPHLMVVVVEPVEERRRLAQKLGAHAACDPDQMKTVIAALTGQLGADAAFDTVGGAGVMESALEVLRPGGTLVLFAHAAAEEPAGFEINPFFKNERRLVATYSGSLDEQEEVARLLFSGAFDPSPLVTHRLPLERAAEAVALARDRDALKIMIG